MESRATHPATVAAGTRTIIVKTSGVKGNVALRRRLRGGVWLASSVAPIIGGAAKDYKAADHSGKRADPRPTQTGYNPSTDGRPPTS